METKTGEVSIKKAGEGKATVVIATIGVRDRDGDVLLAGAFGDQMVPVVGAHDWKMPPIGKARIREVGQEAIADIEFNETSQGKDWYQALKFDWEHPPPRQQYSWGFTVGPNNAKSGQHNGQTVRFLGASEDGNPLQIHEVSPVLLGAGTNTRSLSVKEDESHTDKESRGVEAEQPTTVLASPPSALWHVVAPHHEAVDESPFEATRHYKRLKAGQAAGLYRRAFTLQWPGTIEAHKDSWGFLHHHVDDEGQPAAANLEACLRGMAFLKGWDGVFLPDEVREAMHAHWAAHLRDAGVEVPEFMARDAGLTMEQELDLFLPRAWSISDRKERVTEMLIRMGKAPAETFMHKFDRLAQHVAFLQGVAGQAGEAKRHLDDQEMIAQYAQQIHNERLEEEARVRAAEQAELQASFERMKARDQLMRR